MNEQCRCPNRPYMQALASGSAHDAGVLREWEAQHGNHAYAKARDSLAAALQVAETSVRCEEVMMAGEAVLDMVCDVFSMPRYSAIPKETLRVATDGGIGNLARRHGINLEVVPLSEEKA